MRRIASSLISVSLLAAASTATAVPTDGIWLLRENFCASLNGGRRQCSRGPEHLMFFGDQVYFRDGGRAPWVSIGTVNLTGRRITVVVSREGVGRLVENRIGVDVTELLQDFSFVYSGKLKGERIVMGRVHASLAIAAEETTYRLRARATFVGRRVGDAYEVPPPEEEG
jgi:hypothetical protein